MIAVIERWPRTTLLLAASGTTVVVAKVVKALIGVCPW